MRRVPTVAAVAAVAAIVALAGQRSGRTVDGVRFAEIFTHGADEAAPLVVGLHGRGGSPERMADLWDDYPGKAQIALAQGALGYRGGWAWFDWPPGMSQKQL